MRVVVLWEPVLATDLAGPSDRTLAVVDDSRVAQYWDPGRIVSKDILRAVNDDPKRYGLEERLPDDFVVWDVAVVLAKGTTWEHDFPVPVFYDGPVVDAIDGVREAIGHAHPAGEGAAAR